MTAAAQAQAQSDAKAKKFEVVINGTETQLDQDSVGYVKLGELAYPGHDPQALFTVTYRNADPSHGGNPNGVLVAGESVKVRKKGTTFNVRLTTRS